MGNLPDTRFNRRKRNLVNASDAAFYLLRVHGVRVQSAAIRQWASRKRIGSYGHRRERYDLREIMTYARELGLIREHPAVTNTATDQCDSQVVTHDTQQRDGSRDGRDQDREEG